MRARKIGRIVAGLGVALFLGGASGLRAQEGAAAKPESYGKGRIVRTDGTKVRVSSFVLETGIGRVAFSGEDRKGSSDPEPSYLALSGVRYVQARRPPTFASVAQTTLLAGIVGGIVALMASNPWGGPWKETWPEIGAATAACAAAGAVLGLTVRRYRTVYTNPDAVPKPIIKLTLGPVAPRAHGMGISISY